MQPHAKPIGILWIDNPTLIEMPPNPHDPQPLLYESFIPWNPSCYETIMVSNPHENQTLMIHNPHGTQPSWFSTLMILSPPAAPQSFSFGFAVSHPTTGSCLGCTGMKPWWVKPSCYETLMGETLMGETLMLWNPHGFPNVILWF